MQKRTSQTPVRKRIARNSRREAHTEPDYQGATFCITDRVLRKVADTRVQPKVLRDYYTTSATRSTIDEQSQEWSNSKQNPDGHMTSRRLMVSH